MSFSELLLERASPIRERIFAHPFVRGIGDGTLPVEKFRHYMCQDYAYLIEYCRVFALASAKGPDLAIMGRFAELLHLTLNVEMDLHRSYAAEFGISREELEDTVPAATTHAYTRHLLNSAWSGSIGDIVASILPCQWDYWELGCRLSEQEESTGGNRYSRWIETYASVEFGEPTQWVRELLDQLAGGARQADLDRMEQEFMTSTRYELMFWDMAWGEQGWPV